MEKKTASCMLLKHSQNFWLEVGFQIMEMLKSEIWKMKMPFAKMSLIFLVKNLGELELLSMMPLYFVEVMFQQIILMDVFHGILR